MTPSATQETLRRPGTVDFAELMSKLQTAAKVPETTPEAQSLPTTPVLKVESKSVEPPPHMLPAAEMPPPPLPAPKPEPTPSQPLEVLLPTRPGSPAPPSV